MTDAMTRSYSQVDAIVCGLYFDESRMFDFLKYAKIHPVAKETPFICVNVLEGTLSYTLAQGIKIACRALGVVNFVDLSQWKRKYGTAEAHHKFCQLIDQVTEY